MLVNSAKILLLFSMVVSSVPLKLEPPSVRVMVVGDIMMHSPVTYSGYDNKTKSYQFDSIFKEVTPIFEEADFVIGNLETPITNGKKGYTGYPRFSAPKEILSALKNAGVDVLTTANNHSLDQWGDGLIQTLNYLDNYQIGHTGTYRTLEEKQIPLVLEHRGIKIGIIANTYGTNGLPLPKDKPFMVNLLDIETIKEDVELLKKQNVDYIMAMIHYGYEYHRLPSEEQKMWTELLFDNGVDFVLGSHPHVVQPLEIRYGEDGQSDKGVIYSLGNFLSAQMWEWKDYGIILDLTLEKDFWDKKMKIKEVNVIPTYVYRYWKDGRGHYEILPTKTQHPNITGIIKDNGNLLVEHVFQYQ